MGEKVEASAAVTMMYFFCRFEKVEYRAWVLSSGVSSSDAGRTSVCFCFVGPSVFVDMMSKIDKDFQPLIIPQEQAK